VSAEWSFLDYNKEILNLELWPLLCSNIMTGVAGITADANSLINYARNAAQRYLLAYDDDMPVEQLAQRLCDLKQGYTQYGGKPDEGRRESKR
jgi:hypothetical protein